MPGGNTGGGKGWPGVIRPSGPGSTAGQNRSLGQGGTPQGAGSSAQTPARSLPENTDHKRSTPRVSSKALAEVTDSMR